MFFCEMCEGAGCMECGPHGAGPREKHNFIVQRYQFRGLGHHDEASGWVDEKVCKSALSAQLYIADFYNTYHRNHNYACKAGCGWPKSEKYRILRRAIRPKSEVIVEYDYQGNKV